MVILTVVFLATGCKTLKLTENDFRWIPYKGNETLVFNSTKGETDTIFLLGTTRNINPDDPLAVFPTNQEHYTILYKHSDPTPPNEQRYIEGDFITLHASGSLGTFLSIHLSAKDSRFYGEGFLPLKELDTMKQTSLQTKNKTYNDIIILTPESNEYTDRSNFLTKIYWSRSEGLIRFDKKDATYWELAVKYSP